MQFIHSPKDKRMIRWMLGILMLFMAGIIVTGRPASAASANVSITTKNTTVTSGDVVYVVITVKSSQEISGFEGYFSYDNRVLQFQTGGSVVYGNDDEFRVEDVERESGSTSIKYSVKFLARHEGHTTITLKKPYNVFGESTSDKMSVSHNPLTIVVNRKGQETGSATPAPSQTAQMQPSAAPPEQPKQASGVTPAPTGKKKKKKAKTTEPPAVKESPTVAKSPQDVSADGVHAFSSQEGVILQGAMSIRITSPEDDQIPQGFGKTVLKLDDQEITAYALESETEHTYVLVYGQSEDTEGFYLYDKEQNLLMPYDKVRAWYRSNTEGIVSEKESQAVLTAKRLKYVVGILLAFSALMLLAVISIYMRYKGMNPDDLGSESDIND
ncbi:MAG: hypothetical protein Q4D32_02010 [Eubacteriales bacterium]|nr:hypothetical protein [Eubacteriales bacterium]